MANKYINNFKQKQTILMIYFGNLFKTGLYLFMNLLGALNLQFLSIFCIDLTKPIFFSTNLNLASVGIPLLKSKIKRSEIELWNEGAVASCMKLKRIKFMMRAQEDYNKREFDKIIVSFDFTPERFPKRGFGSLNSSISMWLVMVVVPYDQMIHILHSI